MSNRWGHMETVRDFIFGAPKSLQMVTAAMKLKDACSLEWRVMINLNSILKSRDIILPTKVHLVKALVFPVVMYGCDSWTIKKAKELMLLNCGAGEDFWESLGLQGDLKPVYPKGNQSWIFIGRTDAETETPILCLPDAKNWLIGKDPDAGKDWRQEEKGMTEDEMVGWHHWLDGHEFEQALADGDGQGSLACYSPWGCKEPDMTEWLNWPKNQLQKGDRGEQF